MYLSYLKELLSGYVSADSLSVELDRLGSALKKTGQCFAEAEEAQEACRRFSGDVPVTWVPMGTVEKDTLIGLHLCSVAAERKIFPWLRSVTCSHGEPSWVDA